MERSPLPVRNDVVCHFHSSSSSLWKQRKLPVTKQRCRTPPYTIQCTRPPPPAAQFVSVSLAARTNHWRVKKITSNSPTMAGLLVSPFNQNTESQALSSWRSMPREDNDQSKISKFQWNTSASHINTELKGRSKGGRPIKKTNTSRERGDRTKKEEHSKEGGRRENSPGVIDCYCRPRLHHRQVRPSFFPSFLFISLQEEEHRAKVI